MENPFLSPLRRCLILLIGAAASCSVSAALHVADTVKHHVADTSYLDEPISVGYATETHRTMSGSIDRVNEKNMNTGLVTTPLDALRGRVSGVSIQHSGNSPAALAAVRVRGTTSLTGGNDPLVIIDGVFSDLSALSSVYPSDIENFTILKDASETAQYGARGASGVIEVTTKKGKQGAFSVSYDGRFGVESVSKTLDMLSGDGFRQYARERQLSIVDLGNNTNFQEEITRLGLIQNHHIAFGGGTENSQYRASLGFVEHEQVIRNIKNRNFTAKVNITQRAFSNRLVFNLGLFGSLLKNRYLNDVQKAFYSAATFNPTYPNHPNNQTGKWDGVTNASQITHPIAWMDVKDDESNASVNTHLRLDFNINKEFTLTAFGSYTYNVIDNSQYFPTSVWAHGQAYRGERKVESLLGNLMLSYKKSFGLHQLNILGLAEAQKKMMTGFHTTVTNFSSDQFGYDNLQAGATRLWEGTASAYEEPHQVSFLGRVNYVFAGKYIATVNARADASSMVGVNNKWGFFPSASVAWVLTEEEFMKDISFLNNLKFSTGYGLSGNLGAIDSYNSMQLMKPNGIVSVDGTPTVTLGTIRNANPDLKWEVKRTFNVGLDAGLFDNRLIFSLDYYNSRTDDMLYLYDVSVPPFAYNKMLANLGSMRNTGVELGLGFTPLRTKDMELNINMNLTFQQNKLLSLSGYYKGEYMAASEYTSISDLNGAGFHGGYNHVVYQIVGQPLGVFYLPKCTGLVPNGNGGYKYEIADLDGGGVDLEDGRDRYIAGQAMPKTLLGSNISFRYKQFDLSVQINGAFGHKIYNGTSLTYMNVNIFPDYNILKDAPARMIQDQTATDYWLENGDYVNIDYVTVGWNIPLGKLKRYIHNLRLSASVNNLATITGYSGLTPIINSSIVNNTLGLDDKRTYPVTRSFAIGLNFNF